MSGRFHPALTVIAVLLASVINVSPMFFYQIGGDIFFHYVHMDCVASQFWQGDLYPRWCFDDNAGLGSPTFLFYFVLPYYATALFYPLHTMGLSQYGIFILACFLAAFCTGLTCFSWLKDIVKPRFALLGALLFLFMPYRMEALVYRAAYTELWAMAWMPLVFKYTRRVAKGENGMASLAVALGLVLLSSVPCAFVAALASGIYMLMVTDAWKPKIRYALGMLWGGGIAVFHILPAMYYRKFMAPYGESNIAANNRGDAHFPNSYVDMHNVHVRLRIVLFIGLMIVVTAVLSAIVIRCRSCVQDVFVRREIGAWAAILAVCTFLLLPMSSPIYDHLGPLALIAFPWRMQNAFMWCAVFMAAVSMQWLATERRYRTMNADMMMFCSLLFLLSFAELTDFSNATEFKNNILTTRFDAGEEYRTQWVDEHHFSPEYLLDRIAQKKIEKSVIVSGNGNTQIERWAWDGIRVHTLSSSAITVRLDHIYFPIWSAQDDKGETITLHAEDASGQMLLDVPAGDHTIVLTYSAWNSSPYLIIYTIISLMALLGAGAAAMGCTYCDKSKKTMYPMLHDV